MLKRLFLVITLAFALPLVVGSIYVRAQGLPQAPTADTKARQGGTTAGASLTGTGGSALEPYLITWLLPAFGLITILTCVWADKRTRRIR